MQNPASQFVRDATCYQRPHTLLHCSAKNLTQRCVQVAVMKSWSPALLMRWARVMNHGSLLLAIAPPAFPAGGFGSFASRAEGCGFARVVNVRGKGLLTPGNCI